MQVFVFPSKFSGNKRPITAIKYLLIGSIVCVIFRIKPVFMKTLGIIPSRFASTRFPGKPLVKIGSKTMIQRVYQQALQAKSLTQVVIATDDERIHQHVQSFGGQSFMTKNTHQSGTDRCAEVATKFQDMEAIVNIQGDEPFIHPDQIDRVVRILKQNTTVNIVTLARKITHSEDLFSPNIVKVVFNQSQQALYFSRQPIPFVRTTPPDNWLTVGSFYQHIGLYGYRRPTLLQLTNLPTGKLEELESLEQLRWLENGFDIGVGLTNRLTAGIDTPEDLKRLLAKGEVD